MKCGFLFSNFGHDRCCCRGLRMERTLPPGPPQKWAGPHPWKLLRVFLVGGLCRCD